MAGKMFEEFVTRITDSWDKSQADLAYRVKYGTQPEIVMIGTSIEEILAANAFYIVILAVLYFWMSRRENDFKSALKPGVIKLQNDCEPPHMPHGCCDLRLHLESYARPTLQSSNSLLYSDHCIQRHLRRAGGLRRLWLCRL
jgi:hypothetical protein